MGLKHSEGMIYCLKLSQEFAVVLLSKRIFMTLRRKNVQKRREKS